MIAERSKSSGTRYMAPEHNMGGFLRRNELNAFVSQSAQVNPLEQSLSPAQQGPAR